MEEEVNIFEVVSVVKKKDKIISQTGLDKIDILLSAKVNHTLKNYFSFPFPFIKQVNPSLLSF